jgi:type IV pilus assembly protein PilB
MLKPEIFKKVLKKYKFNIKPAVIKQAEAKAAKSGQTLAESLVQDSLVDEVKLYQKIGDYLDVPFISLKNHKIKKEVIDAIPGPVAGTHHVVAYDKGRSEVKLAMTDPTDIQTIEFLRRKTSLEPKVYITTPSDLKEALRQYHSELEAELEFIKDEGGEVAPGDLKKAAATVSVVNIINSVLENAVYEGASA